MCRKILIIILSELLRNFGVITQALAVFIFLIFILSVYLKITPYTSSVWHNMEMYSIITSMLTLYCALFIISDNPEVYNSDDLSVQEADNGCKYFIDDHYQI